MNCLSCGHPNVTKNFYFVQKTQQKIPYCRSCFTKEIFEALNGLEPPYLLFQPDAPCYRIQISSFADDFPHDFRSSMKEIRGACSFCKHEAVKTLWYSCMREDFREKTGERLGKRCIYANLSELFKKKSGLFLLPETRAMNPLKKSVVEFLSVEEASFKFL